MLNVKIGSFPIGPEGKYGSVDIAIVDGKLTQSTSLSPKAVLDEAAKAIGGAVPAEIATFLEASVGLA